MVLSVVPVSESALQSCKLMATVIQVHKYYQLNVLYLELTSIQNTSLTWMSSYVIVKQDNFVSLSVGLDHMQFEARIACADFSTFSGKRKILSAAALRTGALLLCKGSIYTDTHLAVTSGSWHVLPCSELYVHLYSLRAEKLSSWHYFLTHFKAPEAAFSHMKMPGYSLSYLLMNQELFR